MNLRGGPGSTVAATLTLALLLAIPSGSPAAAPVSDPVGELTAIGHGPPTAVASTPGSPPPALVAVRRTTNELWVWQTPASAKLVALARAHSITRLLVWVSPGFSNRPRAVRKLADLRYRAIRAGLAIDALGGDPSWVDGSRVAAAWAAEVRQSRLFDRIHLDIEPHGRADWSKHRPRLITGLLTALRTVRAAGLPVDADIPSWYHRISASDGVPLDVAVMRVADGVTIMAYRDTARAVIAAAETSLAHAAEIGTPAWIGVNTGPTGRDPASTSFRGQPPGVVAATLTAIELEGRRWRSFAGLAIHDSASLARLR